MVKGLGEKLTSFSLLERIVRVDKEKEREQGAEKSVRRYERIAFVAKRKTVRRFELRE